MDLQNFFIIVYTRLNKKNRSVKYEKRNRWCECFLHKEMSESGESVTEIETKNQPQIIRFSKSNRHTPLRFDDTIIHIFI